ncbi:MAG TPA: hypothetical protein VMD05_08000 [Candidatus Nanoarchaeia archaeon]|nr:hypothetical protein [Candidatus Nanoarchaeia archaeon]
MNLSEAIELCRIRKITEIEGYQIWLVSDILTKALLPLFVKDSTFSNTGINIVEGANYLSDPKIIPEREIWILDYIAEPYWKYIIRHEVVECNLRNHDGMTYSEAHNIANKEEWKLRIKDVIETLKNLLRF